MFTPAFTKRAVTATLIWKWLVTWLWWSTVSLFTMMRMNAYCMSCVRACKRWNEMLSCENLLHSGTCLCTCLWSKLCQLHKVHVWAFCSLCYVNRSVSLWALTCKLTTTAMRYTERESSTGRLLEKSMYNESTLYVCHFCTVFTVQIPQSGIEPTAWTEWYSHWCTAMSNAHGRKSGRQVTFIHGAWRDSWMLGI